MSLLLTERHKGVLRLTLNRPSKRNALNEALCMELVEAIDGGMRDDSVRALLLTASGASFCAGMDLEDAALPDAPERTQLHERLFSIGYGATKPIVAAVNGPALGGGAGLVANAHVVLAAQGSSFGLTEVRIGLWPYVIFRVMVNALGERRALELSLTGRIFSTTEAQQYGLVHEVTPAFELEDRAVATAELLAAFSSDVLRRGLEFAHLTRDMDWEAAGRLAASMRAEAFRSADFQEGIRAFREKRRPVWPAERKD